VPLDNARVLSNLCEYGHGLSDISLKLDSLGYIFVTDSVDVDSSLLKKCNKVTFTDKIAQINSHYEVQGHSRSSIKVSMESPYGCDFPLVVNANLAPFSSYYRLLVKFALSTGDTGFNTVAPGG